jgi:short chain dehydrogenase
LKNFANRVVVITGAASGFGREFANIGAKLGMKLVLADVQQAPLDAAIAELKAAGASVVGMRCDVSKGEDVEALAKLALDSFGGVNLLFNNAGVGSGGLVWENTVKDWERVGCDPRRARVHAANARAGEARAGLRRTHRQYGVDGGLALAPIDGRIQRFKTRGGCAVGDAISRLERGRKTRGLLSALPRICPDRDKQLASHAPRRIAK